MHRISIKQMLRSIMFMMLVMVLLIEQPIQALAITDYGDGTGASSGSHPSGSWLDMNYAFQGYRMYIIDMYGRLVMA